MDAKELEKTYGIRIPVPEYAEYYLKTLLKSKEKESFKREIDAFDAFEKSLLDGETLKSFKYKLIESSVAHLKAIFQEKVSSWTPMEHFVLETKEFKPEDGKCYISFDVRQANWTVSKYFLGLDFPNWETYTRDVLNFPEALAYSKPLRQAIMGQVVNPKRYDSMQKYLTWKHLNEIKRINPSLYTIASINSEEIILEVKKGDNLILKYLDSMNWVVPVKFSIYDIKIHENYSDKVIVKEFLNENWELDYKSMFGVNGHRYYLHFKTLILEQPLEDEDLLFKLEGKIFKWCGNDFKDFKEWNYLKKWIKPLIWSNDYSAYVNKGSILYSVLEKNPDNIKLFDIREKTEHILKTHKKDFKDVVSEYHFNKISSYINN